MVLGKDKLTLANFESACQLEWLETNGLGGWSGSTLIGCNTRRYHGLLVAATNPPTGRMNLVSKLDEAIIIDGNRFELGTNLYEGHAIQPAGYIFYKAFKRGLFPEWTLELNGIVLQKTISMVYGENTTIIIYEVLQSPAAFEIEFLPLIAARGYHALRHANSNIFWDAKFNNGIFRNLPFEGAPEIYISVPGSSYHHDPNWFYSFEYAEEKNRGLDYEEDLFNHGKFMLSLKAGDRLGILISTKNPEGRDAHALFENESIRKNGLLDRARVPEKPDGELGVKSILTLAADQFLVRRGENLMTVIAGYHWFTDWGRDTMISLPGLCLSTSRPGDAKRIIAAFAKFVSMGMLPNRFLDNNEPPEYNNVDGTLWYFIAIHHYLEATGDKQFVKEEILPVLKNIIDWHYKGTRFHIHVDVDGLLYAGEKGQQLTWMDAKIGDWVVTPRMGKPVEIQALWYNALRIFSDLLRMNDQSQDAVNMELQAEKVKESFGLQFWNEENGCLIDGIDEEGRPDFTIRANQVFAISLPFPLIAGERALSIMKIIEEKLYTPVGLRSLNPQDSRYFGIYAGDPFRRDSAYHQGTVWSWLLGAYIEAIIRAYGVLEGMIRAKGVIEKFKYHLNEGGLGSVSEIFDGNDPHIPRGCIAQAWGVAEILRVMVKFGLD